MARKAPTPSSHETALEPRPHTQAPQAVLEISADQLRQFSEQELVNWAESYLGIRIDPTWTKSRMLTYLMNLSLEVLNFAFSS